MTSIFPLKRFYGRYFKVSDAYLVFLLVCELDSHFALVKYTER